MAETPEEVFFKYSADCAYDLLNLGIITRKDYDKIRRLRETSRVPDREFLETRFANASKRIRELAEQQGLDYWSPATVRKYFLEGHNQVIDSGVGLYRDASELIKELCKVRVGVIVKKQIQGENVIYTVDYDGKEERAIGNYLPDANEGDRISTHWKVAVEKL